MCATTKYVSVTWKSTAGAASNTPDSPPPRNVTRKPIANSIGVWNVSAPRHIVPIQLKNLIPVGTAIRNEVNEKNGRSTAPVANMWCAQTAMDSEVIAMVASTIARYPNSGLRLNTGITSEMIPKYGSATIYT